MRSLYLGALLVAACGGSKTEDGPQMADLTQPDGLKLPEHEVITKPAKVELPAIPDFTMPALDPNVHDPRELRIRGKQFLDKDIEVRGYITWIYDCNAAIRAARAPATPTVAEIQKEIDASDMTMCEVPKFHLASAKDADPKTGLWVVDVPRAPNLLERTKIPKDELAEWPAVPKIAVGDYVAVTGRFSLTSRHMERHGDGLLQFRAVEKSTPTTGQLATPPAPLKQPPAMKAPDKKPVELEVRNTSIRNGGDCAQDLEKTRVDIALDECRKAIRGWDENHAAWYLLGLGYAGRKEWTPAAQAFARAASLVPDDAMYQLMWGIAQYEATVSVAREAEARLTRRLSSEQVALDTTRLDFDDALAPLQRAAKLDPKLWRAHYYAGRILRDQDRPFDAATELTAAVAANPSNPAPAIALVELYRKWDYSEQAVAVGRAVVQNISSQAEAADLWYELGLAYDDARLDEKAIDALSKALDARRDFHKARFARGQVYARMKDFSKARVDIAEFQRSADSNVPQALRSAAATLIRELPYR